MAQDLKIRCRRGGAIGGILLVVSSMVPPQLAMAAGKAKVVEPAPVPTSEFYRRDPVTSERGSLFWLPVASFAVPGYGAFVYGQPEWGAAYLTTAIAADAFTYGVYGPKLLSQRKSEEYKNLSEEDQAYRNGQGELERKTQLASQINFASRSFSAWHTFRLAVETRRPYGEFSFMTVEETPYDAMLAPFQFEHMLRWTTFVPMAVITGIYALSMYSVDHPREGEPVTAVRDPYTTADAFYTATTSFLAGTHEELMFRGWLLPLLMQKWNSPVWANIFVAGVFGLAHLSADNPIPVPQLLLGWHLGYVAQKRNMTLSEAIFIHTWWDVVAFLTAFQIRQIKGVEAKMPVLWLPPVMLNF